MGEKRSFIQDELMGVYDKHHLTMIDERKYYIFTLEIDLLETE